MVVRSKKSIPGSLVNRARWILSSLLDVYCWWLFHWNGQGPRQSERAPSQLPKRNLKITCKQFKASEFFLANCWSTFISIENPSKAKNKETVITNWLLTHTHPLAPHSSWTHITSDIPTTPTLKTAPLASLPDLWIDYQNSNQTVICPMSLSYYASLTVSLSLHS